MYHFPITAAILDVHACSDKFLALNGEPGGNRTHDRRLKRALLYQLSYELSPTTSYLESLTCRFSTLPALRVFLAFVANL